MHAAVKKYFGGVLVLLAAVYLLSFRALAAETLAMTSCQIIENGQIRVTWNKTADTPSDDGQVYLFALGTWEDGIGSRTDFCGQAALDSGSVTAALNQGSDSSLLFSHMVLATKQGGSYQAVSGTMYLTNPEACATYTAAASVPGKKGLLVNLYELEDAKELGVKQGILSVPIHTMTSGGVDWVIREMNESGMAVTVILLNPVNSGSVLCPPGAEGSTNVNYYGFHGATSEGAKELQDCAIQIGSRYSGADPSLKVTNWIIGNEIDMPEWNFYSANLDFNNYLSQYEKGFRILYNGIKSASANARVDLSFSYAWNMINPGLQYPNFGVRNYLNGWNALVKSHGDIDWGVAYHPYPAIMTEPEFWTDTHFAVNSADAQVVNFNNLHVLTDFMQTADMRNSAGNVRHITLSEVGFTSQSATRGTVEAEQAAAYAYAYYIAEANPYIDGFFLNRQVDNASAQAAGYYFGLWNNDTGSSETPTSKKQIWQVFKEIDTENSLNATAFAKSIIGISKWSDVISGFSRAE